MTKETLNDFYERTYYVGTAREPYFLVWFSKKSKENLEGKTKPEKWDLQTTKNYIKYLEEE